MRQTEGQKRREEEEDVSSHWMNYRKEKVLEIERGSTRSPSVENSFWKRLWTFRKTDYGINEFRKGKNFRPLYKMASNCSKRKPNVNKCPCLVVVQLD
jgi:hypothetical protein